MQKNIKFYSSSFGVRAVPVRKTDHFEENKDGSLRKLKPIINEWKTEPDLSDRQFLKLYSKDKDVAIDALAWRCSQHGEINFTLDSATKDPKNRDLLAFLLPGSFSEELTPDDVHQCVEDYILLREYFPAFEDIFLIQTGQNRFQIAAFEHLIQAQDKISEILSDEGFDVPAVPKWIKRTLEIRKMK